MSYRAGEILPKKLLRIAQIYAELSEDFVLSFSYKRPKNHALPPAVYYAVLKYVSAPCSVVFDRLWSDEVVMPRVRRQIIASYYKHRTLTPVCIEFNRSPKIVRSCLC